MTTAQVMIEPSPFASLNRFLFYFRIRVLGGVFCPPPIFVLKVFVFEVFSVLSLIPFLLLLCPADLGFGIGLCIKTGVSANSF